VGRHVRRKGFHVLIDAVGRLHRQGRAVRLWLGGDGPERAALESRVREAGLADVAELPGFLSDALVAQTMRAADVVVMPSIMDASGDTEGLGIPLLEAMANDTAVVGSDIGGIVDIIVHGENGLLVPPGDAEAIAAALARLHDDPELCAQLVAGGRAQVDGPFAWPTLARRTLLVFEEALRAARRP